jgi:hypothetical protein
MSVEEYELEVARREGLCDICKVNPSNVYGSRQGAKLVVDHDHNTGRIRGLLCMHCNLLLGHAKDDAGKLKAAADYLQFNIAFEPTRLRL